MMEQNRHHQDEKQLKAKIEQAKFNMYAAKKRQVQSVHDQKRMDQQRKDQLTRNEADKAAQQRETIRDLAQKSRASVQNYHLNKQMQTKNNVQQKIDQEKNMIYKFEKQAQDLEDEEE